MTPLTWFPVSIVLPDGSEHREALVRVVDGRVGIVARTTEGLPTGRRGTSWVFVADLDGEVVATDMRIPTVAGTVTMTPNGTCRRCGNPLNQFVRSTIPADSYPTVEVEGLVGVEVA